ncbi:hypothetical protein LINPERPRIM_LOCUS20806 [Linum perenne]
MSKTEKRRNSRKKKKSAQKALTDTLNNMHSQGNASGGIGAPKGLDAGSNYTNSVHFPQSFHSGNPLGAVNANAPSIEGKIHQYPFRVPYAPETYMQVEGVPKQQLDSQLSSVMVSEQKEGDVSTWNSKDERDFLDGKASTKKVVTANAKLLGKQIKQVDKLISGVKTRHKSKHR